MSEPFDLWFEGSKDGGGIFMVAPDGGDIPMGVAPTNLPTSEWISRVCKEAWMREADKTLLLPFQEQP